MKYKIIALILTLAMTAWAQTSTPAQSTSDKAADETKSACCDPTASTSASASSEHNACKHAMSSSKDSNNDVASCCSGKSEAACCKGKEGKSCAKMAGSAGCCGEKCSAAHAKDCCSNGKGCCSHKEDKQTAHSCRGDKNQCGHAQPQPAPGN